MKKIDVIRYLRGELWRIAELGYDSQAPRATETVLACVRIAENARNSTREYEEK